MGKRTKNVAHALGGNHHEIMLLHRETDIDEVLQVNNVFVNVSKGEVAKTEDLTKAFGKIQVADIVKEVCTPICQLYRMKPC